MKSPCAARVQSCYSRVAFVYTVGCFPLRVPFIAQTNIPTLNTANGATHLTGGLKAKFDAKFLVNSS